MPLMMSSWILLGLDGKTISVISHFSNALFVADKINDIAFAALLGLARVTATKVVLTSIASLVEMALLKTLSVVHQSRS